MPLWALRESRGKLEPVRLRCVLCCRTERLASMDAADMWERCEATTQRGEKEGDRAGGQKGG